MLEIKTNTQGNQKGI